ncbi:MAG: hypothetical protein Q7S86_02075 [bacterium]|nr:hypothetical protein [bacterium]
MSNVQFEDGSYAGGRFDSAQGDTPVLVKFLLKTGVVKTDTQANYVLIGVAVCAFIIAIVVFYKTLAVKPPPQNQNVVLMKAAKQNASVRR